MTRKEALEILDTIPTIGEQVDALEMAIEALEQEPCEDAISRQAAIDAIYACYIGGKEAVDKAPYSDHYAEGIDDAVNAVEELPSVSTEKTGRWIEQKDVNGNIYYDCSECDGGAIGKYEYCPFCGARMVEPQESEVKE